MLGALYHALTDMITSLLVACVGALTLWSDGVHIIYLDGIATIIEVTILMCLSIPLGIHCAKILMDTPADDMDVDELQKSIAFAIGHNGIVREMRIWRYGEGQSHAATFKISCAEPLAVKHSVRKCLQRAGITNMVIECTDPEEEKIGFLCHAHDKTSEEEI
mmetsp:Transcript_2020/g.3844  ORF Transcript_2020/g.3844 Transcript_2020/m.3844 type:complete len:162 (-) Transcript_2020:701-1186(-)